MAIQHDRIRKDIETIAGFTETPGEGASRPTFSDSWRRARDYVIGELQRVGCRVRIDAIGNVHARPPALAWDEPAWISGSHLDSVPNGGDFDGVAGVVVPLELLRAAHDDGIHNLPFELVILTEEEGTTFDLGLLGSRTWVGDLTAEDLGRLVNSAGVDYLTAGIPHGVQPDAIWSQRIRPETKIGFVEVHVEQGPGLWKRGEPVAVVNAVAGRRQYRCRIKGRANHAGSTSMIDRRDALACAADLILQLEQFARDTGPQTVTTVGQIVCRPNAVNVVPGEVTFTIDFRSSSNEVLEEGHGHIEDIIHATARRRGVEAELATLETLKAVSLDDAVCERLQAASERAGKGRLPVTMSGALHDAAIVAPYVPTAMLFVASRDGISHNPEEFSRTEDITAAAEVLWEMVRETTSP